MPYKAPIHNPFPSQGRAKDERESASRRGYGRRWQRLREVRLSADPVCQAEGCTEPANEVDHIVPKSRGGEGTWENLQALCKSCHSKKTRREKDDN